MWKKTLSESKKKKEDYLILLFLFRLFRTGWNPTCPEAGCCGTLYLVDFTHSLSIQLTRHSSPFTTLYWVSLDSFKVRVCNEDTHSHMHTELLQNTLRINPFTWESWFELSCSFSCKVHRQWISASVCRCSLEINFSTSSVHIYVIGDTSRDVFGLALWLLKEQIQYVAQRQQVCSNFTIESIEIRCKK